MLLPPRTWRQELTFDDRFKLAAQARPRAGPLRIVYPIERSWRGGRCQRAPIGFVSSGPAYAMLCDALREMGLLGEFPILKLAISYPVDTTLVDQIAGMCERIIVVEERRSFIEKQIAEHIGRVRQNTPQDPVATTEIWGKEFPRSRAGHPVHARPASLAAHSAAHRISPRHARHPARARQRPPERRTRHHRKSSANSTAPIALRTPAYCPGCPHRDSSSALLEIRKNLLNPEYMQKHYGKSPWTSSPTATPAATP